MLWATARARVSSYRGIIIVIILPSRRRGARALATIFVWRVQHVENYTEHALHEEERRGSAPPSNDGYGTAHHVGRRRDSALTLATTRPYMFLHDARVTPMRGDLETYVLYIWCDVGGSDARTHVYYIAIAACVFGWRRAYSIVCEYIVLCALWWWSDERFHFVCCVCLDYLKPCHVIVLATIMI